MSRSRQFLEPALALLAVCVLPPGAARACGPWFPSTILNDPNAALRVAPVGDFCTELGRMRAAGKPTFQALPPEEKSTHARQTAEADLSDLRAALKAADEKPRAIDVQIEDYAAARKEIAAYCDKLAEWREQSRYQDAGWARAHPPPGSPSPHVPESLPAEFAIYLNGAIRWHAAQAPKAVAAWEQLLRLPAKERHYRSTWAAYMIGRACLDHEPAKAVKWFRRVRELAAAGYADSLGLAAASCGWEARAELDGKNYTRAVELYLLQDAAGDPTARMSLRLTAERLLGAGEEPLRAAARHEPTRQIVTAYFVANGGPNVSTKQWQGGELRAKARAWLAGTEAAGVTDLAGAGRLAWAAYASGEFALAARWAARAAAGDAVATWIRAKLLGREGRLNEAAALLERAVKALPRDETWREGEVDGDYWGDEEFRPADRAAAELAALRMARGRYAEALDLLLRSGFWTDAAYVAERVLTPDELKSCVDSNWPAAKKPVKHHADPLPVEHGAPAARDDSAGLIRYLLARRLARLGRWKDARPYYPPKLQERLDAYTEAIRAWNDHSRLDADRARSLWAAAKIARREGMELLGTEVEPDWRLYYGAYEPAQTLKDRGTAAGAMAMYVTRDERDRLERHKLEIEKRFHYRYIAAEHAWAAARIMPNDLDETAKVLCTAGTWLKNRDPKAADRFYKALVTRCGGTSLGRQADRLRWFPKVQE